MTQPEKNRYIEDEKKRRQRMKRIVIAGQLGLGILVIVLWEVLTRLGVMDSYYWSSPSTIYETAKVALLEGTLWSDLVYTSLATLAGFASGTFFGSLIGLSFWWSAYYSRISEPYLIAFNAIPKIALGPVIVILFGIGFFSKVMLAFLMTVIVTALAAHSGIKAVDEDLEKLLYSLGAKRRHVFTKVVVPTAMPWIVSSLRINIALALAGTIVGEFISSRQGIGRMILYAGQILDIDLVWVGVCVLSILSLLMYAGTVSLEKLLLRGQEPKQ
ncbi:ABC transporter permease [Terribacillus halophilus]|uniref:ABC transporter permease n=1 Tax=Terribacillus halophilus TaxID=361279 RepID=UPI00098586BE|nr:ABC transporter permease [Terribacillus halophilus]